MSNQVTTLTATRRLAAYLVDSHVKAALPTGGVIERPFIFALGDALFQSYEQLLIAGQMDKIYLTSAESLLLIEDIIQASKYGEGLLKLTTTAKLFWQAWQNFHLWECQFEGEYWEQGDNQAFYEWFQAYEKRLADLSAIDQPGLVKALIHTIDEKTQMDDIFPGRTISLYGFDDIPPLYQSLFSHLRKIGWQIVEEAPLTASAQITRYSFHSIELEFEAAINWAKERLQDPQSRIGLIVPELPRYRLMLEKMLQNCFHPMAIFQPEPVVSEFYNISAGQPLNTVPLIADAMEKLADFQSTGKHTYHRWAALICQYLAEMEWPGQRALDSVEHQATKQWQNVLDNFSKLDKLFPATTFSKAFIQLKHILQDVPFQPQSKIVRLHVLGVLEAAGQSFTDLWVTGLTDEDWPSLPNPNPFLPIRLQKILNMPHATFERQLQFSENMMARLLSAAPNITLSHPRQVEGRALNPSACLGAYVETAYSDKTSTNDSILETVFKSKLLERIQDTQGPALRFNQIPKGVNTLRLQANCAFRAFAEVRLNLPALERVTQGLSMADRGTLVHRTLEALWKELKNQTTLLKMDEGALIALVEKTVALQIQTIRQKDENPLFWETEVSRLKTLMLAWLALEKKRKDFEVVESEVACPIMFQDKTLNIRIDRIDRDALGHYFIIDYKTGRPKTQSLLDDVLLEPQLPIYCFNQRFPFPSAVVFAQVHAEKCQFIGLTSEADAFPGLKENIEDWEAVLKHWRHQLDGLVEAFAAGEASVTPANKQICEYCHLKPFCRIQGEAYVR